MFFLFKTERKECHVFSVCFQLFRINMLLACVSPHSIGMAHALKCPSSKSRHRAVMSSVFETISSICSATLPLRNQWLCLTKREYVLAKIHTHDYYMCNLFYSSSKSANVFTEAANFLAQSLKVLPHVLC